jgi:hypothetical protein
MTSYLSAADATISLLQKLRKQDIHQGVVSPVSLRFTASTPANLSMSYSINPSQSLGRCYIELPSLFYFYKSIQIYDAISKPHTEESVNMYQVRYSSTYHLFPSNSFPFLSRVACTGANTLHHHLQHSSTNLTILSSMKVLRRSKRLPKSLTQGI